MQLVATIPRTTKFNWDVSAIRALLRKPPTVFAYAPLVDAQHLGRDAMALVTLDRCERCGALRLTKGQHLLGDHAVCFRLGPGTACGKPHEPKRHDILRLKNPVTAACIASLAHAFHACIAFNMAPLRISP